jgi:hypothetical protein
MYGDPLHQLHAYEALPNVGEAAGALAARGYSSGHWGWPFLHLVATPTWVEVPAWKVAFIAGHVAAVLAACSIGVMGWGRSALSDVMTVWAVGNTVLIVSAGPYWGFHSFDRYAVWALPAYGYLLTSALPRSRPVWAALGAASVGIAAYGLGRHLCHRPGHIAEVSRATIPCAHRDTATAEAE